MPRHPRPQVDVRVSEKIALSVPEAAALLDVGEQTIRKFIAKDPTFPRFGRPMEDFRRVLIPRAALDRWVEENTIVGDRDTGPAPVADVHPLHRGESA